MAPSNTTRSRLTILQTPIPTRVGLPNSSERSTVSALSNPSPTKDGLENNEDAVVFDDDDLKNDLSHDDIERKEFEKDVNGGDGGDSNEEGDECLILSCF